MNNTVRYAAGNWYLVARERGFALLPSTVPVTLLETVWETLEQEGSIAAVIDKLTAAYGLSLSAIPPFAMAIMEQDDLRVAVRGGVRVAYDDGHRQDLITGGRVQTWVEQAIPPYAAIVVTPPDAQIDENMLPVASAVVRAGLVTIGANDAIIDDASTEGADEANETDADVAAKQEEARHERRRRRRATEDEHPDEADEEVAVVTEAPEVATVVAAAAPAGDADIETGLADNVVEEDPDADDAASLNADEEAEAQAAAEAEAAAQAEAEKEARRAAEAEAEAAAEAERVAEAEAAAQAAAEEEAARVKAEEEAAAEAEAAAQAAAEEEAARLKAEEEAAAEAESVETEAEDLQAEQTEADEIVEDAADETEALLEEDAAVAEDDASDEQPEQAGDSEDAELVDAGEPEEDSRMGDHDGHTLEHGQVSALREEEGSNEGGPSLAQGRAVLSTGRVLTLDRVLVVGRRPRVTRTASGAVPALITVDSPTHDISRNHLEIRNEGESVVVTDLNTTNGTVLLRDGEEPRRLHPGEATLVLGGDVVDIGDEVTITFEDVQ